MQPLLSVCFHIQCTSFNLEQQNQLHIATCLENEWGSMKLAHFETVRLNRGPQNKLKFSVQPFHLFSWYHLKVKMPYYNNSTKKFCLYMKHCHCLYNTLRVTETGNSRISIVAHCDTVEDYRPCKVQYLSLKERICT